MTTRANSSHGLHGLVVATAALIGVFMTTPGQTVGVAPFIDLIGADLGLGRAQVLMLYSVGTLLGILPAPLVGRLIDRFGPRRVIVPIALALSAACIAVSVAQGSWSLAIAFIVLRGVAIGGLSLVSFHMLNLWFDRLRGRVTAFAMMGLALGGLVFPQAAEVLIQSHGWRAAYGAFAVATLIILVPVGLFLFRDRPGEAGAAQDFGWTATGATRSRAADLTLQDSARTAVFWYLLTIACLVNAVGTALLLDHMRLLDAAGLGRAAAVTLLGAVTTAQALATLGGGALIDRFSARRIGFLGLSVLVVTVVCAMAGPKLGNGLVYAVALGAMIGLLQLVQSAGLAEAFGTGHLGRIRGVASVIGVAGAAAGPLPFIWSPEAAYWIFLTVAGVAAMLGIMAKPAADASQV